VGFVAGEATQGELQGELLVDISLGLIALSIYISLYKCCIYKIDTRLRLADCDLQQQPLPVFGKGLKSILLTKQIMAMHKR